jgi:hypothetical protein
MKSKELKEALKFICALANSIGEVAKDGEINLGDMPHLVPLLYKLPSAIDGMAQIPEEIKELTAEDMAELSAMVKDELDLPQDKIEEAVEQGLDICLKLYALANKLKG